MPTAKGQRGRHRLAQKEKGFWRPKWQTPVRKQDRGTDGPPLLSKHARGRNTQAELIFGVVGKSPCRFRGLPGVLQGNAADPKALGAEILDLGRGVKRRSKQGEGKPGSKGSRSSSGGLRSLEGEKKGCHNQDGEQRGGVAQVFFLCKTLCALHSWLERLLGEGLRDGAPYFFLHQVPEMEVSPKWSPVCRCKCTRTRHSHKLGKWRGVRGSARAPVHAPGPTLEDLLQTPRLEGTREMCFTPTSLPNLSHKADRPDPEGVTGSRPAMRITPE